MRVSPRALSGYELSLVFGVCLAAVLVLNLSLIAMPPVWDAVGVFAPAIFLYESGLDLPEDSSSATPLVVQIESGLVSAA
jgi:hypothetical protein